jgi:5-keto 4-deoxyuronate isomerase
MSGKALPSFQCVKRANPAAFFTGSTLIPRRATASTIDAKLLFGQPQQLGSSETSWVRGIYQAFAAVA